MSILSQSADFEKDIDDSISRFIRDFHISSLLKKCNGEKQKGVPAMDILRYKMANVFKRKSMYMQIKTNHFSDDFSKNTFYRFLNHAGTTAFFFSSFLPYHHRNIRQIIHELNNERR